MVWKRVLLRADEVYPYAVVDQRQFNRLLYAPRACVLVHGAALFYYSR